MSGSTSAPAARYVDHEVALLARISGLSVPRVLPTLDGGAYTLLGDKPVLLFTALPGRSYPNDQLTPARLASLGRAAAALHRADPAGLAPHRFHPRALFEEHYLPMRALVRAERPDAAAALDAVFRDGWAPYELAGLPRALVHADLFADNLHFDELDRCGVLDFEAAGEGPRLLDLAVAVHALCFDAARGAHALPRVDALLGAYAAESPLTDAERDAWPALLTFAAARFLFTRVRDFDLAPGAAAQHDRRDYREFLKALGASRDLAARLPR
ncbi:MAG: phosphotransferase [Polyangiales bacterium]